jgi:hypothetical protein
MTGATVTRVSAGLVCFAGLPFTPTNIQATPGNPSISIALTVSAGIQSQVPATCTGVSSPDAWVRVSATLGVDGWDVYVSFN